MTALPADDRDDVELSLEPTGAEPNPLQEDGTEHRRIQINRDAKHRLDKYLQARLKHVSRNQIQKLIQFGGVRINDKPAKASAALRRGDVVDLILPPPPVRYLQPEPIPLNILYEDDDFIIINKQADLIVHPARSNLSGTLLNALAHHFQQRGEMTPPDPDNPAQVRGLSSVGVEECRPGIVHRLDRHTTGVMVVAKRDSTHWMIARQFEDRQTLKAYLALVHGTPDPPDAVGGVIDYSIGKHPTIREAMSVRHDSQARQSVTLYRIRRRYKGYTLVELELKTGRTHQIRVHLSYIGCPIAGDLLYGGEAIGQHELLAPPNPAGSRRYVAYAREKDEAQRIDAEATARDDLLMITPALHAGVLGFTHPTTGQLVRFTAPVPSPMRDVLERLSAHPADGPVATEGYHIDLDAALPGL